MICWMTQKRNFLNLLRPLLHKASTDAKNTFSPTTDTGSGHNLSDNTDNLMQSSSFLLPNILAR